MPIQHRLTQIQGIGADTMALRCLHAPWPSFTRCTSAKMRSRSAQLTTRLRCRCQSGRAAAHTTNVRLCVDTSRVESTLRIGRVQVRTGPPSKASDERAAPGDHRWVDLGSRAFEHPCAPPRQLLMISLVESSFPGRGWRVRDGWTRRKQKTSPCVRMVGRRRTATERTCVLVGRRWECARSAPG